MRTNCLEEQRKIARIFKTGTVQSLGQQASIKLTVINVFSAISGSLRSMSFSV